MTSGGVRIRLVRGEVTVQLTQGMGLGDAILQLGAACYIAAKRHPCRIVCNSYCYESVRQMLEATPNVEALDPLHESLTHPGWPKLVDLNDPGALLRYIKLGPQNWYRQWDVPFSARWDFCPIAHRVRDMKPQGEPVVFIHDDPTRGQVIDLYGFRPAMTASILEWVPTLLAAREIHCMDSSFYHLVESMDPPPRASLFFHAYVRRPATYWPDLPMRHNWQIIKTAPTMGE